MTSCFRKKFIIDTFSNSNGHTTNAVDVELRLDYQRVHAEVAPMVLLVLLLLLMVMLRLLLLIELVRCHFGLCCWGRT